MSQTLNDPIGQAILDFARTGQNKDILVKSDVCDDDVLSSAYLFRTYDEMSLLEQMAIDLAEGKVLDVGAGAGPHSFELKRRGKDVQAIDISPGAVSVLRDRGLAARQLNFFDLKDERYDTILFLMNGIGIGGTLEIMRQTLLHAKTLLSKNGKILCDSTDIRYLYEDEDGSYWIDLNAEYYGEVNFLLEYENHSSDWFDWLYIDFETLRELAEECGFTSQHLYEENDQYLVELCVNE
ncbi:MAG: hypothetical protein A3D92_10165 [Bacteroidetes bacterium RIFCSPHIGHO2_02_FULL_44_7]|nr:MAG: hypothetical protein A3D92_10165 [Bacteroidetes bacterium RIFCSPHIGHO2_02_FULL_44_7]